MGESVIQLKDNLKKAGIRGIALDIDETLSDTGPHWWNHMIKFHKPDGLTFQEFLNKYEKIEYVPGWQTEEARKHIGDALDSDEFNEAIPLLHESNVMVNKLVNMVPIIAYITARPINVWKGTENWLAKHGFLKAPVILRPTTSSMNDLETKNSWKAGVLKYLYPEIIGIVDDNMGLLSELVKENYEGKLFLYGPQTREINPKDYSFQVILSPDWNHVIDYFSAKID